MCYASPFVELLGLTTPVFLPSGLKTGVVPLESWHETPSFQTGFTPMAPRMNTITAQSAPMLASQHDYGPICTYVGVSAWNCLSHSLRHRLQTHLPSQFRRRLKYARKQSIIVVARFLYDR